MNTTGALSGWAMFKNALYIPAFILGLSTDVYGILGVLMILDVITGIARSGTIHGWNSVTSRVAEVGIVAKVFIFLVPMVLALTAKGAGFDLHFVASGALTVLVLSEGYSILGNIQSIYLKKDLQEFDAINFILTRIRDIVERIIRKPDIGPGK